MRWSRKIAVVMVGASALLYSIVTPAHAAPDLRFRLSQTAGPTGSIIGATAVSDCPLDANQAPSTSVTITVLDPQGGSKVYLPRPSPDGAWSILNIVIRTQDLGAGTPGYNQGGLYQIAATCQYSSGAQVSYEPETYQAEAGLQFTFGPTAEAAGRPVNVQPQNQCPRGSTQAEGTLYYFDSAGIHAVSSAKTPVLRGRWQAFMLPVPKISRSTLDIDITCYTGLRPNLFYNPQTVRLMPRAQLLTKYVALGDSYSSGEGESPYIKGSDQTKPYKDQCHRSVLAYAPILDDVMHLGKMTFVACSGAVTQDLFDNSNKYGHEAPQLDAVTSNTRTVTLTIGGNDIGFKQVLEACIRMRPLYLHGFGCSKNNKVTKPVANRMDALSGKGAAATSPDGTTVVSILSVLRVIHHRAPQANIYVAGYPQVFGRSRSNYSKYTKAPSGYACKVYQERKAIKAWFDYDDAQWMNKTGRSLNALVARAVADAVKAGVPATYIDPLITFQSHGICDKSSPWLFRLHVNAKGFHSFPYSFHPTVTGQDSGYARAFARAGL